LNDEQRQNARRKFQEACVVGLQTVVNDQSTEEAEEVDAVESTGDRTESAGDTIVDPNQKLSVDVEAASIQSGIPTLVLRQIWAKAADLLDKNEVLPAPGCAASDRMVASTSKKKLHFVTTTKDGRYECDEECPNFMQRFICSHCVAAAEDNNSLEAYVKNYGIYAKTPKGQKNIAPNFTRLSMTNLTRQTAGRKGGKAPPKKSIMQRKTIPYEQRQKRSSLVTSKNETPAPLVGHLSSSASNWDWSPEPPYIPPPYLPTPPYLPPPNLPFTDFTNYCSPYPYPQLHESSTRNTDLNSTNITTDPFFIKFLNGRIKVCAGCKGQHHKNSDKGSLSPPQDICLGHKESL